MNKLQVGFARVNITPMLGIGLRGYYQTRISDGVLDELYINALAFKCEEKRALLLSIDHCGPEREVVSEYQKHISDVTGVPIDAICISATHTHTAPHLYKDSGDKIQQEYYMYVYRKMADVAKMALDDLKPARMGWGVGTAPDIAFVRRFRMKDGSVRTNPGIHNPDIVEAIGEVDERVSVLRFDREAAETLVLVHFGNHPDTVGGCRISADWPGFLRKTVEKTLDNVKCIFINGAQGDVAHLNLWPTEGYLNDTFNDFDDVYRGYGHAKYMGRVVAGGVLQAYDKVKYIDVEEIKASQREIYVPSNMPTPEEMPEAHRIHQLHQEGKDDALPYEGMMLTTVVAAAERKVYLEHGPKEFEMILSGIALGNIALLGIPGEPFAGIGKSLKETEGWELVLPICLTNGNHGYFPMQEAYDEGGYESQSSNFRAGVAEQIIEEGKQLLVDMNTLSKTTNI